MEITDVKVFTVREEKLKAFVSIVIDDCFMVNDIKVIQGRESRFISMPSRRKKNGEFKDVAHPLDNDTRRQLEERILAEYDRVIEEGGDQFAESEAAPVAPARLRRRRRRSGRRRPEETAADQGAPEAPQESASAPVAAAKQEPAAEPLPDSADETPATLEEVVEKHLSDSFWST